VNLSKKMNGYEGLKAHSKKLVGLDLSPGQLEAFETYRRELLEWNERHNLTAITDPEEVEIKHILDSLSCLQVAQFLADERVVDVGTGAGLPGLPLKIVCPSIHLTLVESIRKKVDFCEHVISRLGLSGVEVIHGRAETLGQDELHRGAYDWALARAVAIAPVLLEYLLPLLKLHGRAILQKGTTGPQEIQSATQALAVLGGEVLQMAPVELPKVTETRYLILVRKCAATPGKYPRRPGMPAKRPLE
jgi:16S rRNA (guanine527-N7)-methyltransferase